MTNLVAKLPTDMTAWDSQFADSAGSDIDAGHDSTHFNVTTATHLYEFEGAGLGYQTVGSHLRLTNNGGDLHDLTMKRLFGSHFFPAVTLSFDTDAFILSNDFFNGDWNAIENLLFSGDDTLKGSKYNDHLLGFGGGDSFDMTLGGTDTVEGGNGDDLFNFGTKLHDTDFIDGGDGTDLLEFGGYTTFVDYFITLDATVVCDIEVVVVDPGHANYTIQFDDSIVPDGGLAIDGSSLSTDDHLHVAPAGVPGFGVIHAFGGEGGDSFEGGLGADAFSGGGGDDTFRLGPGGDTADGGPGSDTFFCGSHTDVTIDGGEGDDSLGDEVVFDTTNDLPPPPSLTIDFGAPSFIGIETIKLEGPTAYTLRIHDSAVGGDEIFVNARADTGVVVLMTNKASAKELRIFGTSFDDTLKGGGAGDSFFAGKGKDVMVGFGGDDFLDGSDGKDVLNGGRGADDLSGGANGDTFVYAKGAESTGLDHDTIDGFDAANDRIKELFGGTTNGVDAAVNGGTLSEATFDADMHAAMAGNLGTRHALIFTPDDGDFSGDTFLVIDANHKAGYQAGADIVILLEHARHLGQLDADNFI